jgi:guanine deaminase
MPYEPNPEFLRRAIELARQNVLAGTGGPFAALIVRDGQVIAEAANSVTTTNDPTAHGEVNAIRKACAVLGTFSLAGCEIYSSCEPCPMCLAALYWSRCAAIFYGNNAADAARVGFDDSFLYEEVKKPLEERTIPIIRMLPGEAWESFAAWEKSPFKVDY